MEAFSTLAQLQVPNSPTLVYTAPLSTQTIIKSMVCANTTGSDATIKLWVGGSADVNVILPVSTILAGGHGDYDGAITLQAGKTLYALGGTNNALTLSVFGVEESA